MSYLSEELVLERLKVVKFPGYSRDIVSFGLVKEVKIAGSDLIVRLSVATNNPAVPEALKRDSEKVLGAIPGVRSAKVVIDITNPPDVATTGQSGTTRIFGSRSRDCDCQWEGRRRQIDCRREPRCSAASLGSKGWSLRLRHLRSQYIADVRCDPGAADGHR